MTDSSAARDIVLSPSPLNAARVVQVPRSSIAEIVRLCGDPDGATVEVNGLPVPRSEWHLVPEDRDHVLIYVPVHGGGGKDPMRTLLTIAVIVAASALQPTLIGALGEVGGAIAQAGILTAGMFLVDALAPIRMPSTQTQDYTGSPSYSLTGGRNEMRPFSPVPAVLGQHRMFPPLGARVFTELAENGDEFLRMLFVWGYGPLGGIEDTDLRIGDTPLLNFSDIEVESRPGYASDKPITILPPIVTQEGIGTLLSNDGGPVIRTAPAGSDEISVDIILPRGLVEFRDNGSRAGRTVSIRVRYREVGEEDWFAFGGTVNFSSGSIGFPMNSLSAGQWSLYAEHNGLVSPYPGSSPRRNSIRLAEFHVNVTGDGEIEIGALQNVPNPGVTGLAVAIESPGPPAEISWADGSAAFNTQLFEITDRTTSVVRKNHNWRVDRDKQYEVELYRETPDSETDLIQDEVNWYVLRGIRNEEPINFPHPLAITAIRIKATDQLQSVIDSLNADPYSICPVWDGEEWGSPEQTKNPAALFRYVLMNPANARARSSYQIDDEALGDWYEFCVEHGYEFNMIRDFSSSVWDCLSDIAAAGRASPTLTDGVWSVVIDRPGKPVVNHITPRNSWGFSAEKPFYFRPHAFRIPFINAERGYVQDERIVYDDGYDESNATLFESIQLRGFTDPDLVWKFGRFHIAQARLRPETYTLFQDFEHLVARRGQKVRVSHDVPLWGSGSGRVKALITEGSDTAGVVVDDRIISTGESYVMRFRLSDGQSVLVPLAAVPPGETDTVMFADPVATAQGPQVGDLFMFGVSNLETVELLVKNIERHNDLVAKLILVDEAPEIYEADQGAIPPFDPDMTGPVDITRIPPSAPSIISIQSGTAALEEFGGVVRPGILVSLAAGPGTVRIRQYRIRYREQGTTPYRYASSEAEAMRLTEVREGATYQIQAQAISIYGVESAWSNVSVEAVIGELEDPSNVTGFRVNVVGYDAHLSWNRVTDPDRSHYRIRWSPEKGGATWAESVDMIDKVSRDATSATVPAMVGTYLIKCVDYGGRESPVAAAAITNIARLQGLNFVEEFVQETPDWNGTGDGAEYNPTLGGLALTTRIPIADDFEAEDFGPGWQSTGGNTSIEAIGDAYSGSRVMAIDNGSGQQDNVYRYDVSDEESLRVDFRIRGAPGDMPVQDLELTQIQLTLRPYDSGDSPLGSEVLLGYIDTIDPPTEWTRFSDIASLYEGADLPGGTAYALIKITKQSDPGASGVWQLDDLMIGPPGSGEVESGRGTFDLDGYVDLGGVFTSRLMATLKISGENLSSDLYDTVDLYTLSDLYGASEGQYSAALYVSITDDDPAGTPTWSDWIGFVVGDYTARAYKFRIELTGLPPSVTPIVQFVRVEVDMPDRFFPFEQSITGGGSRVDFAPPFYVIPEIGLSVNNGQEGDKYTISNKDETGFDIAFTNGGSPVSRVVSGIAQGYGSQEV